MELTFYDDLNIFYVYNTVISDLQKQIGNIEDYQRELKILERIMTSSHNPSDRISAKNKYNSMKKICSKMKDNTLIKEYQHSVSPLLRIYQSLSNDSKVFGIDNCTCIPKRVHTIISFLNITSTYTTIRWKCTYDMSRICIRCFARMYKQGESLRCSQCPHTQEIVKLPGSYFDNESVQSESSYDASKNYKKEYLRICGVSSKIPDDEISDIYSYLYRIGIYDYTHNDVRNAIKACGYENYNDTNFIYSELTSTPLPPLLEYMDMCTNKFCKYWDVFHSIQKEGRNITNIHFLTKLFLWQEGISFNPAWFKSLSANTEAKHKRNIRKVCNILKQNPGTPVYNWSYPSKWDLEDQNVSDNR